MTLGTIIFDTLIIEVSTKCLWALWLITCFIIYLA